MCEGHIVTGQPPEWQQSDLMSAIDVEMLHAVDHAAVVLLAVLQLRRMRRERLAPQEASHPRRHRLPKARRKWRSGGVSL